ncbi:MsnO8 family LLM class oxidoreductase [Sediminibacillus dalangtanensis]|uniref:MsnO8 family LLM class oxidoreductase n=1 Tax=Sediminibacillus dalangtanensis TaxID=2729421 RepID=A0ABX7VWH7_9BACI|nr:LLM class flavin-dependent oxidoreductase [Sediminibacillus dalangtanensis]QTN01027.1 MsnO8 family LLM class oxidoreductase [Sediminibacillus dalangtanensis]
MVRYSVLDQSPVPRGGTAREALQNTVKLAQLAEQLGYHRFWISEHHLETLAHSSPEVLLPHIAAHTSTIRVGSGGVMLPHYSAYKVAENFRLLEALHPGRIDLGVGRAPGGIPLATAALQENKGAGGGDSYPQQIEDLVHYLSGSSDETHRFRGLKAMPEIDTVPQLWLLGSSGGSAGLASGQGISYAFAQFISGQHGGSVVKSYQRRFKPSILQKEPQALAAFFLVCAETDEKAEWQAKSMDVQMLKMARGETGEGILPPEEAAEYQFAPYEIQLVRENRKRMLVGSPETVRSQLLQLSEEYGTEEFMLASMNYYFADKKKGYELLAKAFS